MKLNTAERAGKTGQRGNDLQDGYEIISLFLLHRDFADASHSKSPKSTAITVLYGIFSLENSYPSQQLKCNDNKFSCCENMRKQI